MFAEWLPAGKKVQCTSTVRFGPAGEDLSPLSGRKYRAGRRGGNLQLEESNIKPVEFISFSFSQPVDPRRYCPLASPIVGADKVPVVRVKPAWQLIS